MSGADHRDLNYYERGAGAYRACQADRRFGYFLYLPERFRLDNADKYELCVVIHGSSRTPYVYRDLFAEFGERHDCAILAPMFPVGITDGDDMSSYKFLKAGDIRYDSILLAMIEEVRQRYGIPCERFLLHGFSGGGQFVHRFFYLHAERVLALSVGAPGMVTLLDDTIDWHCGIRGFAELMEASIAWNAMRGVPVQMVIGENDTETWEITIDKSNRYWMPGVNDAGKNRIERLTMLQDSFVDAGIRVQYNVVPGIGHQGYDIIEPVKMFFSAELSKARQGHHR